MIYGVERGREGTRGLRLGDMGPTGRQRLRASKSGFWVGAGTTQKSSVYGLFFALRPGQVSLHSGYM